MQATKIFVFKETLSHRGGKKEDFGFGGFFGRTGF